MVSPHSEENGTGRTARAAVRSATELSNREREIVARAARGATDKEIADDLDLTVATLRTYWMRVRDKLGAVNRTHAIALSSIDQPAPEADLRSRLIETLSRERIASWIFQGRPRHVLLDTHAERLFDLPACGRALPVERLLAHVWTPDRARFERFLGQAFDLRPMTPIELRVGTPGDYRHLIRTVNLAHQASPDTTVLLASTTIHTFA